MILHGDLWLDGSLPGRFHVLLIIFVLIGGAPSLLGLCGCIFFGLFLALLVGIHIFEEGIGEFMDLGVVHLNVFTSERLLHDPVVAQYDVPSGSNAATILFASMVCSVNAVRSSESRMP